MDAPAFNQKSGSMLSVRVESWEFGDGDAGEWVTEAGAGVEDAWH